jgi:hypothetical protein
MVQTGPPKPDGSGTQYSVQREYINLNAAEPAFQKKLIFIFCFEKHSLHFIGAFAPALRFTPLHSVFAAIRFRNIKQYFELSKITISF